MINYEPIIQTLQNIPGHQFDVLRLDLLHPEISGNKWFKLKKSIEQAMDQNKKTIVTFGGAFSNHIAATAACCKHFGLKSIGVIKGEETQENNPTLLKAKQNGTLLHFVSRDLYSQKNTPQMESYLKEKFGDYYLIPEGGNNAEGVLGCMEILDSNWDHDYIFCACGTATTYAGIVLSAKAGQKVVGVSVLKGENKLAEETGELLVSLFPEKGIKIQSNEELIKSEIENNCITNNYCFSGYAKQDKQLLDFKKEFELAHGIPLDHVYTTKLFYAVFDLLKQKKIKPGSKILVVHSGGLQGNAGFEERYGLT